MSNTEEVMAHIEERLDHTGYHRDKDDIYSALQALRNVLELCEKRDSFLRTAFPPKAQPRVAAYVSTDDIRDALERAFSPNGTVPRSHP